MGASLKFDGLTELRAALRKLPEDLAGEASHIVEGIANGAASEVRRGYSRGKSGRMIDGVQVTHLSTSKAAAGALLKSSAPEATIWEYTKEQRRQTRSGANRGVMRLPPENKRMIPIVVRARKRMYAQLTDLLRRAGFVIEGAV